MNIKHILAVICYLLFHIGAASAQGTLLYLNGKEKRFSTAEIKGEYILYKPEHKEGNWFKRADRYNVFAIIRDETGEEIIYQPDTIEGGDPTIEEVRDYIKGGQFAIESYNKPANKGTSLYVGVASSLAGFYGLPIPILYTTIIGTVSPKLPKSELDANHSELFIVGYQKKSRNIKIKQSLIYGGIGFSVGVAWFAFVFANDK